MDHARQPRNFGEVDDADVCVHADNPMCGDDITVYLHAGEDDSVRSVHFSGSACSICIASASLMTLKTRGQSHAKVRELSQLFQQMITGDDFTTEDHVELGDLLAFEGVRQFPMRAKCATLPWHALDDALQALAEGTKTKNISVEA